MASSGRHQGVIRASLRASSGHRQGIIRASPGLVSGLVSGLISGSVSPLIWFALVVNVGGRIGLELNVALFVVEGPWWVRDPILVTITESIAPSHVCAVLASALSCLYRS